MDFNSHTREGVTDIVSMQITDICNFNSHTREGVTVVIKFNDYESIISTHTPVRV